KDASGRCTTTCMNTRTRWKMMTWHNMRLSWVWMRGGSSAKSRPKHIYLASGRIFAAELATESTERRPSSSTGNATMAQLIPKACCHTWLAPPKHKAGWFFKPQNVRFRPSPQVLQGVQLTLPQITVGEG